MTEFAFKPASTFTERVALIVALVAPPNAGKTFSGLRLARGIAGPDRRIAVLDTEGGRTLHLKDKFDFDVMVMEPPHRPARYVEAARAAQDAGYAALLIDSFSMEWRGVGGVLDWADSELEAYVDRQRAVAAQYGKAFDEARARNAGKSAAFNRPKSNHRLMMNALMGLRIPIILSIRGEMTYDPETKKEIFKSRCDSALLFEVTCSFRLASDNKGIVDLSDRLAWKMEGSHMPIFKHGDQISERHGEALEAWATGKPIPGTEPARPAGLPVERGTLPDTFKNAGEFIDWSTRYLADATPDEATAWEAKYRDRLGKLAERNPEAAMELTAMLGVGKQEVA